MLADDEIKRVWSACDEIGWPFGPLVKLLLLTGQRRDEVAEMHWSEVDLDTRLWTIPRERAKNDVVHQVPLSDAVVAILRGIPRIGNRPDFVFTTGGIRPVTGFSRAKRPQHLPEVGRRHAGLLRGPAERVTPPPPERGLDREPGQAPLRPGGDDHGVRHALVP